MSQPTVTEEEGTADVIVAEADVNVNQHPNGTAGTANWKDGTIMKTAGSWRRTRTSAPATGSRFSNRMGRGKTIIK